MASILRASTPGEIIIENLQGNTRVIALEFYTVDLNDQTIALDLTQYADIRAAIKEFNNPKAKAFLVLTIGAGLRVVGVDNNILEFTLGGEFWNTQTQTFYYDILFKDEFNQYSTLIKGTIEVQPTVTEGTT